MTEWRMNFLRQPAELQLTGDLRENWTSFRQSFEFYSLAVGLQDQDRRKVALLLTVAGRGALELFNTFTLTEQEKNRYQAVIDRFEQYCTSRRNETYERYVFRNRVKKESESVQQFVSDLRVKGATCNFGTLSDSMIRDQIVIGVQDKTLMMQLLNEADLTLEKAVQMCQEAESKKTQIKEEINNVKVEAVQKDKQRAKPKSKKKSENKVSKECPGVWTQTHLDVPLKLDTWTQVDILQLDTRSQEVRDRNISLRTYEEWRVSLAVDTQ